MLGVSPLESQWRRRRVGDVHSGVFCALSSAFEPWVFYGSTIAPRGASFVFYGSTIAALDRVPPRCVRI